MSDYNTVCLVIGFIILFLCWGGFMLACFRKWLEDWAVDNKYELSRYELHWIRRGPLWYTFIIFPIPVFRIHIKNDSGESKSGWVWIPFFGGTPIWDKDN